MSTLRLVLGDQCSPTLSSLADLAPGDVVLMAEVMGECTYVRHHRKKIVLVLSAMRHFAAALRARGVAVDYVALDDPANTHTLRGEFLRAVQRHRPGAAVVTEPGEWRLLDDMRHWHEAASIELDIRADTRFLCAIAEFRDWAAGRRTLRMEFFYREMRRRHRLLMQPDDTPEGQSWNFDAENRKRLPPGQPVPPAPRFAPDAVTQAVIALVRSHFADHFGDLDDFALPVTPHDAEAALRDFLRHRLPQFGDWQDAMKAGEAVLFHSLISTSLNVGLLDPLAICRAAERAFRDGQAKLNCAEGFIRQILGWREFVRGIYWLHMPEYATRNALGATRKLPWFYWSGETRMRCMAEAVGQTRAHAYSHHIQRLMITGNFALLAGIDPDEVDEWYLVVYADAYQWVEMPNTRGMALFADGGVVGSKPYAASGAYINRMSDFCGRCHYDVHDAVGERACPFNALYWDFVARHQRLLQGNTRMAMPLRNWERMAPARRDAVRARAASLLAAMESGQPV
jgi:deoxyribodipyrimidine photolyase-related protein